jgi:ABC-2 type transport system ATP-binding protein
MRTVARAPHADDMIEATALTKRYGRTCAVDDLSFQVLPGRVTGLLGPNGAGKSTTMRMILGLDRPDGGAVTVNGEPFGRLHRPLHTMGALLDARAVHGGRSAYNHLLCLARSNGIGRTRVDAVLETVGLMAVRHKRVGGFSLGMSQRLGIAVALLGDPPVLMFDEPVNGLDPEGIRWIRDLLRGLAAEGRTVLVSSHLLSEMALTADHLVVMGRGRLIADASTADIVMENSTSSVRVRGPQRERLARVVEDIGGVATVEPDNALTVTGLTSDRIGEAVGRAGLTLHELSPQVASLEAAFLELTSAGNHGWARVTTAPARGLSSRPAPLDR